METKHLEKLLKYVPGFKLVDYEKDECHDVYVRLRSLEIGYEDLLKRKSMSLDGDEERDYWEKPAEKIEAELWKVRFQIMDLILHNLYLEIKEWENYTERREEIFELDKNGDSNYDNPTGYPDGIGMGLMAHMKKALEYFRKTMPGLEKSAEETLDDYKYI